MKSLEHFKEKRDWLVHRSVYQNGTDLYVNEKREALMNRTQAFSKEAKTLQKLIASELEVFVVSHGECREKIGQEAAEVSEN